MELPDDVRAGGVHRRSAKRAFTAGMHVTRSPGLTPDSARRLHRRARDMLAAIRTAPVATVCAVDGTALRRLRARAGL